MNFLVSPCTLKNLFHSYIIEGVANNNNEKLESMLAIITRVNCIRKFFLRKLDSILEKLKHMRLKFWSLNVSIKKQHKFFNL